MSSQEELRELPGHLGPVDSYLKLEKHTKTHPEFYASGPITSGLWGKLLPLGLPPNRKNRVVSINTKLAERVGNLVAAAHFADLDGHHLGALNPEATIIMPFHLPQQTNWREIDYLSFWMMLISRLTPSTARDMYQAIKSAPVINFETFNDYNADRLSRWQEYLKLVDYFVDAHHRDEHPDNCVSGLIAFPDHQHSLGSSLELQTAHRIGIPVYGIEINSAVNGTNSQTLIPSLGWSLLAKFDLLPEIRTTYRPDIPNSIILQQLHEEDLAFIP